MTVSPTDTSFTDSPFGLDRLVHDVADMLCTEPDEVDPDESLLDQGLDSIRLMSLVSRWRTEGAQIAFVDLAERPTLREWAHLLAPSAA
ncbi:phosphopantetheine-binding protein [Streptomyces sp. NPDC098789]|uniref:phosphopantetheine-binding protein n=1 Tax=Streptomyces sp. NPDC098789 TaxID=3366098 RepID=UPI0037F41CE9